MLVLSAAACGGNDLPDPSSPTYVEAVSAFYRGVAAAQAGESGLAQAAFQRVTELIPGEPAGWANLGLTALQRREPDEAATWMERARSLAPDESRVQFLSALVESERGRPDAAAAHLRQAVELDPQNLAARYLLTQLVPPDTTPDPSEAESLIDGILAVQPGNLVALLERARLMANRRDLPGLQETLDRVARRADSLGLPVTAELDAVRGAAVAGDFTRAATDIAFVQTALQPHPAYLADQDAVVTSPSRVDVLITNFLRLASPPAVSAAPDTTLGFAADTLTVAAEGPVSWVRAVWLGDEAFALAAAGAGTLWLSPDPDRIEPFAFPGNQPALTWAAIAPLDFDYDFRSDLLLAGPGGLRLLRQDDGDTFTDVTGGAIPSTVARAAYAGAWAADLDMEGDLDLVLAPVDGAPLVLRNLGNGRFESSAGFGAVRRLRDLAWADLDADGDPDATLLDAAGQLHIFLNERAARPQFRSLALPDTLRPTVAIAVADLDRDATTDLIVLHRDGAVSRLSLRADGWNTEELVRWPDLPATAAGTTGLLVADLDNNGDLDLIASTPYATRVWQRTGTTWRPLDPIDIHVTGIGDVSGDGRLDLLGVTSEGQSRLLVNRGTTDYYSTTIRPRAAQATGDRRINSFGIGGEVEFRAGLLYQKRVIQSPAIHVGLGDHRQVDVARIIWPNGSVQAEFNLAATNETILTRQRLKASCPWVFTYDGERMQFVTDFLWRSALGLRINAQGEAAVIHSEDWIKIRGDQMVARDGFYDVRITAELWESHFFDHVSLMAVDHPMGTEMFVDERFTLPAPELAVRVVDTLRPVAAARDQTGRDVTAILSARDERYLDGFEVGAYQGIATDHYVEITLDDDVPLHRPVWLVANGWVYPTDASINVALTQGDHPRPRGLQLEVPDGRGGWVTVRSDLGFPAGKTKTILIDLHDVFRPNTPRRLRLSTNMEIYWDHIAWTTGRPEVENTTRRLLPATAELRYRGFSEVAQAGRSAPERPDYHRIATTAPRWRDLVGYHTRFGDVRVLNEAVDDRYTIMNAGDELRLRFPALPPPPEGWTRDFVLIGDGWVKDGDFNTGFSTTVRPLPYHAMPSDYTRAPGRLADDPAFRRHPDDWSRFHTRYVTPREFHRALAPIRDD